MLRNNQITAINTSIENDFKSGIHYHATGSGKSWIAMKLVDEFNKRYPNKNILWICERKDILTQQFSDHILKTRNFDKIVKKFMFLDFVNNKSDKWYDSLNSCKFWNKPYLCIVNRCFLTSKKKYRFIKNSIDLVIHDECHSIENNTTQIFYDWLLEVNKDIKIIGFSATPEYIKPLTNVLTSYSVYDAFMDDVILPPKILWVKGKQLPSFKEIVNIIKYSIEPLPYKKIIVWCGIIEECLKLADICYDSFDNFDICLDFNSIKEDNYKNKFKSFDYFYNSKENSILFCAVKHREGSDIPNIDGCIFMDQVEKRSQRVFIQCMGRVLRLDDSRKKKYGLIIDFRAKSTIDICNRVQTYLKLDNIFPWNYNVDLFTINGKKYFINELIMIKNNIIKNNLGFQKSKYSNEEIKQYFKRKIPNSEKYFERLNYELKLILSKNLFENMIRAVNILDMTKNIPHITRGSCGSSLICYLLGISHIDPILHNISFARFINQYRDTLPDIDFDFPHYMRDEVFLKLFQLWGNKVARISNHNYYHEKSALRESLRKNGINKFISKFDIHREIDKYDKHLQKNIYNTQKELEGKFRGYSLHCGGIVYYPNGVPDDYLLDNNCKSLMKQVSLNKIEVAENKDFKIDILSSRGLSQLHHCHYFREIDFNMNLGDDKTIELLTRGDNIGITLAETPLMRKALKLVKPKTITDLAICLAIIRPAAKDAKKNFEFGNYDSSMLIYDDDIIQILSKLLNCDEEKADKIRRGFMKNDKSIMELLEKHIKKDKSLKVVLNNLRKYGFCKAHALSYAQLVWQLAYQKANYPKRFWEATLKNVKSCYRNWVHIYEAFCCDVSPDIKKKQGSIYAMQRNKKINLCENSLDELRKFGYWTMLSKDFYEDCYYYEDNNIVHFKGLIAFTRMLNYGKNKRMVLFIGVGRYHYIEINIIGNIYYDSRKVIVKGNGILVNNNIECKSKSINFI